MISRQRATSLAAIGALALCILIASIGTDTQFIGGSVLGAIVLVGLARKIGKRWTRRNATWQLEMGPGHATVVSSQPLTSIADDERELRERTVIDVEPRETGERIARWLEDAPSHLRILQGILRDYDRLEKAAHEAEQDNERLRDAVDTLTERLENSERDREQLQQEASRLKERAGQYRQEIAMTVAALVDGLDHLEGVLEEAKVRGGENTVHWFPATGNGNAEGGEPTSR